MRQIVEHVVVTRQANEMQLCGQLRLKRVIERAVVSFECAVHSSIVAFGIEETDQTLPTLTSVAAADESERADVRVQIEPLLLVRGARRPKET